MTSTFVCSDCGGTFERGRPDEDAQHEALEQFGRRGDAPGMVIVCDDCYRRIMTEIAPLTYLERVYVAQLSEAFSGRSVLGVSPVTAIRERIGAMEDQEEIDRLNSDYDAVPVLDNLFVNGSTTFPGVPVGILGRSPIATRAGGVFGGECYAADDQEPPRPSVQDAFDATLDDRQRDDEGRAQYDQERAQAEEDAVNHAMELMHGDGDE